MSDAETLITVGDDSWPASVAAAITRTVRKGRPVTIEALGALAGERAMTAAAVAWRSLKAEGIHVACAPSFAEVRVDGKQQPALKLEVEVP